jgi:hypothetical protein
MGKELIIFYNAFEFIFGMENLQLFGILLGGGGLALCSIGFIVMRGFNW